jgi:hypothetical protein
MAAVLESAGAIGPIRVPRCRCIHRPIAVGSELRRPRHTQKGSHSRGLRGGFGEDAHFFFLERRNGRRIFHLYAFPRRKYFTRLHFLKKEKCHTDSFLLWLLVWIIAYIFACSCSLSNPDLLFLPIFLKYGQHGVSAPELICFFSNKNQEKLHLLYNKYEHVFDLHAKIHRKKII